ncbi:MAG: hypothetical protein NVSMB49_22790 [Ktedonobacteraceae bacterium]
MSDALSESAEKAFSMHRNQARLLPKRLLLDHSTNSDEDTYAKKIANYAKCLLHNALDEVDFAAYETFTPVLTTDRVDDFERLPTGAAELAKQRKIVNSHLSQRDRAEPVAATLLYPGRTRLQFVLRQYHICAHTLEMLLQVAPDLERYAQVVQVVLSMVYLLSKPATTLWDDKQLNRLSEALMLSGQSSERTMLLPSTTWQDQGVFYARVFCSEPPTKKRATCLFQPFVWSGPTFKTAGLWMRGNNILCSLEQ